MTIDLDFAHMMYPVIAGGPADDEWQSLAARFAQVHEEVARDAAKGRYGFAEIDAQAAEHDRVLAFARERAGLYDDIVVLGIGGSALGAIALRTALLDSDWNARSAGARGGRPRLHVFDNVDPRTIVARLDALDLARTLFLCISKSGGTAETMAQYLVVRARLDAASLPAAKHLVFITDPSKGLLRPLAEREGIPAFSVPANVGGRYSVFSPVGTLPAALVGIDTTALLAGAREIVLRAASNNVAVNSAGAFALLQWRAHARHGQGIHVMMPYSDALRDIAPWFSQLWAESLGKVDTSGAHVGPTPVAALGATDQHSQIQLYMEGPADKTLTFLAERERAVDLPIPQPPEGLQELAYLGGHTFGALLDAERRATAGALAQAGRPNMTITVDRVDARGVGALLMFFMHATVYAGSLYHVNPLDQPGVEAGKVLARASLES